MLPISLSVKKVLAGKFCTKCPLLNVLWCKTLLAGRLDKHLTTQICLLIIRIKRLSIPWRQSLNNEFQAQHITGEKFMSSVLWSGTGHWELILWLNIKAWVQIDNWKVKTKTGYLLSVAVYKDLGAGIVQLEVCRACCPAWRSVMGSILLWASGKDFPLEFIWVLTPFPQNSFRFGYKLNSSLRTNAFYCTG